MENLVPRNKFKIIRVLLSLYIKKSLKSIGFYVSIFIIIAPLFSTWATINEVQNSPVELTQRTFEANIFWYGFLYQLLFMWPLVSIVLACNIISYDFSKKVAPITFTLVSRKMYLLSNIIFLIVHIFLLEVFSFFLFSIITLIILGDFLISFQVLFFGFVYGFILLFFYLSFTFIFSSLMRSTMLSLIIPIFYIYMNPMFATFDMKLLSFSYFMEKINYQLERFIYFHNFSFLSNSTDLYSFILILSVVIVIPIALFIISVYGFKTIEIRVD